MSSFTKGVSFHYDTNAKSQASSQVSTNPTITNNISIRSINELSESSQYKVLESGEVKYEQSEKPAQQIQTESTPILNENEFLKKVLSIYMTQPFYWENKTIVLKPDELLELIDTLLPDKQITITTNDIDGVNCCGFVKDLPVKKVDSIWIDEGGNRQSFKYEFSNLVSLFDEYKISIKFVRV